MGKNDFEIRFNYGPNIKYLHTDTEESAERMYQRIIRFAKNRPRPLTGIVALWDGKWLVKSERF